MAGVNTKNEEYSKISRQNLLTNSQWMAMSGSSLENVGSSLVTGDNSDFNTIGNWAADRGDCAVSSVAGGSAGNCMQALYTGAGGVAGAYITYDGFFSALTAGKLYKLSIWLKRGVGYTGSVTIAVADATVIPVFLSSVAHTADWATYTLVFEATGTERTLNIYSSSAMATNDSFLVDTATLYEVTPAYIAADTLAPDGWIKDATLDVWREHSGNYTKDGSFYSLKTLSSAASDYMYWPQTPSEPSWIKKFAGRVVTFGIWAYASDASHAKLSISDGLTETESVFHSGVAGWEWLEVTATISTAAAIFEVLINCKVSGKTAYFSQPMLVFGSSIGQGNYQPIPNEQILTQANITLTGYTATTSAADATISLEAASSGMIGNGVKAVLVKAYGKDSAAGDGVGFDVQSASGVEDGISIDTQVNNIRVQGQGWVKCDANGDIYLDHRGSGASALTLDIKVIGIEP